jgi:hypothetical protein
MNHRNREEWMRDVETRQRNIVFPDTVANEGRFLRNLTNTKERLNPWQLAGVIVLLAANAIFLVFFLAARWPTYEAAWWKKAINAYGVIVILIAALGTMIYLGNRRRK